MRNKELQDELQKWGDDTDVNIVLLRSFLERISDEVGFKCEFGVALGLNGDLQLTPYFESAIKEKVGFFNPALEICEIEENGMYSANPDDYFMMGDDHVFEDRYLTCTCERDGWAKRIIVKENPTKADLKNWKELTEKVKIE